MRTILTERSQIVSLTLKLSERFDKYERFNKKPPHLLIDIKNAPKTLEQMGYFHAEVLPGLTRALYDAGDIERPSERYAKYWLKQQIGFGKWIEFNSRTVNQETGEITTQKNVVFDPDSFANAKIDDLIMAIDFAVHSAEDRGHYIAPPKNPLKPGV